MHGRSSVSPQSFPRGSRPDELAAVLRLPPSALVIPLDETLEADLLAEDGERLRFRHDLLRQAVVETLPRSLRRALQREAVTVLLEAGAAPREVALQLAESAEEGDGAAVAALREAARSIAGSDAVVAADLSARALELLPDGDADRGRWWPRPSYCCTERCALTRRMRWPTQRRWICCRTRRPKCG